MALTEEQAARILAALESEEEEDETEPSTTTSAPAELPENATIKAIRAQAKRLERDLKRVSEERDALATYKAETESARKTNALSNAGLSPRQAEVFLRAYDDVTDENIAAFKAEVLGAAPPSEADSLPAFSPTGFVGEAPDKKLTVKEFTEMMADPAKQAAAEKAALEGRVAFKNNR